MTSPIRLPASFAEKKNEFIDSISRHLNAEDSALLKMACESLMALADPSHSPDLAFVHGTMGGRYSITLSSCRPSLDGLTVASVVHRCGERCHALLLRPAHGEQGNLIQATLVLSAPTRDGSIRVSKLASDSLRTSRDQTTQDDEPRSDVDSEGDEDELATHPGGTLDLSLLKTMRLRSTDELLLQNLLSGLVAMSSRHGGATYWSAVERKDQLGHQVIVGPYLSVKWNELVEVMLLSQSKYSFSIDSGLESTERLAPASIMLPSEVQSTCRDSRMWITITVPRASKRRRESDEDDEPAALARAKDERERKRLRTQESVPE